MLWQLSCGLRQVFGPGGKPVGVLVGALEVLVTNEEDELVVEDDSGVEMLDELELISDEDEIGVEELELVVEELELIPVEDEIGVE